MITTSGNAFVACNDARVRSRETGTSLSLGRWEVLALMRPAFGNRARSCAISPPRKRANACQRRHGERRFSSHWLRLRIGGSRARADKRWCHVHHACWHWLDVCSHTTSYVAGCSCHQRLMKLIYQAMLMRCALVGASQVHHKTNTQADRKHVHARPPLPLVRATPATELARWSQDWLSSRVYMQLRHFPLWSGDMDDTGITQAMSRRVGGVVKQEIGQRQRRPYAGRLETKGCYLLRAAIRHTKSHHCRGRQRLGRHTPVAHPGRVVGAFRVETVWKDR